MKTPVKHIIVVLITVLIMLQSCFIFKPNKSKAPSVDTTKIINLIQSSNLKFQSLKLKFSAIYTDANNEQNFNGYIKIYHDSLIKVTVKSAFVSLASIYLKKDTVEIRSIFFENQGYNYKTFSYDYGVNLNYNTLENILVGNLFTYPPNTKLSKYNVTLSDSLIILTYRKPSPQDNSLSSIRHQIVFSKTQRKILKHNIWDFTKSLIEFYLSYSKFQSLNGNQKMPKTIDLLLINNADTLKLLVNYEKINLQ